MKVLSIIVLGWYLVVLLWIVLFKLSFNVIEYLELNSRSINLIPFIYEAESSFNRYLMELSINFAAFVPFGLLLSVCSAQPRLRHGLIIIFLFSLSLEIIQYTFAIGVSDITDVVTNTAGGLAGLMLYQLWRKLVQPAKLNRLVVGFIIVALVALISLRTSLWQVRMQHPPQLNERILNDNPGVVK